MKFLVTVVLVVANVVQLYSQSEPYSVGAKKELEQADLAYKRGKDTLALRLYSKHVDSKYFTADMAARMSWMYLFSIRKPQDCELGLKYLQKALDSNSSRSMRVKARLNQVGACGYKVDKKEAEKWYLKSASTGDARGMLYVGYFYQTDSVVDYEKVIQWFKKAGDNGESDGYNEMGRMCFYGNGVKQDYKQAAEWYRKAAVKGNYFAQANLGWMYYNELGVARDYNESLKLYMQAAEQEYPEAYYNIAWRYYHGHGVPKDMHQAISWFEKAAKEGDSRAKYHLGQIYEDGDGIARDTAKAIYWYKLAYKDKYANSEYKLKNLGVDVNEGTSKGDNKKKSK